MNSSPPTNKDHSSLTDLIWFSKRCLLALILIYNVGCPSGTPKNEVYPHQPIEVIVPFSPGGGSDTFARILKKAIDDQELLPVPLVIINAPGAGGTIGSRRAKDAKPDGYTVLLLHDGIMTAKHSGKTLYGPEDFQAIAGTGKTGMVIAVSEDSSIYSLTDLLAVASNEPDTLKFAANLGAPSHFIGLVLEQEHGSAKFRYAQTGGGADRFAALTGKHVDITAFSLEEYLRFHSEGIKALAYLGEQRHTEVPEIPTAKEQGVDVTFSNMQYWWFPKESPPEAIKTFTQVLKQAMESEQVQQKLLSMKIDPVFLAGDSLQQHIDNTNATLAKVDPGTDAPLPNFPLILSLLTVVLGLGLVYQRLTESNSTSAEKEETISQGWLLVAITVILVLAYAITTIWFALPLGITTFIFLLAVGFVLSQEARKERPWLTQGFILANALVISILFHVVFTQVFEIGL